MKMEKKLNFTHFSKSRSRLKTWQITFISKRMRCNSVTRKAFDTVLRRKLLVKLEKIWISRRIVRWKKNERSCWKEKYQTERKLLVEFFQDASRDWSYLTFLTTLAEKVVLCSWNFLIMQYVVWMWRRTVYRKNWISFRTGIIEIGWIWITQKVRSGTSGLVIFPQAGSFEKRPGSELFDHRMAQYVRCLWRIQM